jgi:hypothetical protein
MVLKLLSLESDWAAGVQSIAALKQKRLDNANVIEPLVISV